MPPWWDMTAACISEPPRACKRGCTYICSACGYWAVDSVVRRCVACFGMHAGELLVFRTSQRLDLSPPSFCRCRGCKIERRAFRRTTIACQPNTFASEYTYRCCAYARTVPLRACFLPRCSFPLSLSVKSADSLIGELARRVDRYVLASHLTWALWAVIQANTSEIEVGG